MNVILIWAQTFWSQISEDGKYEGYPTGPVLPCGRTVELMSKYSNLYGDLSATSGLNALRRDREFGAEFLTKFQDKLFFGQDFCSPKNYDEFVLSEYLDELLGAGLISKEVYEKVCRGNAVKLLGLF